MSHLLNTNKSKKGNISKHFFASLPEMDARIDQLMKVIDLRKNGETVDLQKQMGISYRLSYGVALAHIKEIARTITPDNELAKRLWYREVRETMILATLTANPTTLPTDEVLQWCHLISTTELAEQMAINLLGRMPEINHICPFLLTSANANSRATAFFALGWAFKHQIVSPDDLKPIWTNLSPDSETSAIEKRGIGHLLKQLARHSENGKKMVVDWLEKTDAFSSSWGNVIADVKAELDWLNESV